LAIASISVSGIFFLMIPILAGLLLPALAKAKEKAIQINCLNNMKQLGLAAVLYANDNNDQLPQPAKWSDAVSKYVSSTNVFHCPADSRPGFSYAFNQKLEGKSLKQVDPKTVLLFESDGGWNNFGGPEQLNPNRHHTRVNVAFADGSVRMMSSSQLPTLRWDP
jgi:prepilin-type processing-associated H-X9-DG protein